MPLSLNKYIYTYQVLFISVYIFCSFHNIFFFFYFMLMLALRLCGACALQWVINCNKNLQNCKYLNYIKCKAKA